MDKIERANKLIQEGAKEEAHQLLQSVLQENPHNNTIYADVVNIYLQGEMYQEAKDVFARYKQNTGRELRTDFSLSDIEEEEKRHQQLDIHVKRREKKVYKAREGQAIFEGVVGILLCLLGIFGIWRFYPPPLHFWVVMFLISIAMPFFIFYRILSVYITTSEWGSNRGQTSKAELTRRKKMWR
jgi:tetratricopeptide (TPR) repeat protein